MIHKIKKMKQSKSEFDHDQLHQAVSLFIAGCVMQENEKDAWKPLMEDILNNKAPDDQGSLLMIKNISIGAIIIFSYSIENLVKAFTPQIRKRHLDVGDVPNDLDLSVVEAAMLFKTIIPLLKQGLLRYPEPKQQEYFLDNASCRKIFIKLFKYFVTKNSVDVRNIKCFKVEFLEFNYPFIDELLN